MDFTDAVANEIKQTFFKHDPAELDNMSRAVSGGCQDFTECLKEACDAKKMRASNNDLRAAHDQWIKLRGTAELQTKHTLSFAHFAARQMAPYFCNEPPPFTLATQPERVMASQASTACGTARVAAPENTNGWLGVLGMAIFAIIAAPVALEWKFSSYFMSIFPPPNSHPDIT